MRKPAISIAAAAALMAAGTGIAQDFPSRTVRIVASEAGGSGDFVARVVAQGLSGTFGQQVVVENRGGGVVAGDLVAKSAPDGHTLLLYGNTLWLLPLMRKQIPYDPYRDFAPVTMAARAVNVLVVHPSLPVKSVKDLIALARARPGDLNFSSAAPGTMNHLAAELFKSMAKINIVRVSYRGSASALTAVMSGEVQMMFAAAAPARPHVQSGRVRALAVSTANRSPSYPDLPTVAEAGLPGFEAVSVHGIFVPVKTPESLVARLNADIVKVLQRPESRKRLGGIGAEPVGSTPAQLAAAIKDEVAKMGKIISEAGIQER
ncbi:MAG TPA: tripartite tricarboxylate transporter substrate binding protein [Burkholderiales bacterium]|nr:tripartite tricarboxylate transporter substrate binding protein [Burkholderiales bacterium]